MAMMMLAGWFSTWSNRALLLHSGLVALPVFLIPLVGHRKYSTTPVLNSDFLKANVYTYQREGFDSIVLVYGSVAQHRLHQQFKADDSVDIGLVI